jgi:predicted TIM-barrel fold metal-dependent hydrolase
MWKDYLSPSLRQRAPTVEAAEDGDYIVFEGKRRKLNIINAQAGREGKDFKMEGRLSDTRSGGYEARARLADLDLDGLDAVVMFGGGPLPTLDAELYYDSFRAYNRWLADFCDVDRRRFCGVGYLPMRDVGEAIRMLKECAALGFTAVNIPAFPSNPDTVAAEGPTGASSLMAAQAAALTGDPYGARQYFQPEFDPFWEAVLEHDMVLTMHLGGRMVRFEQKNWLLSDMLMSKFAMAEPPAIMLFSGLFDRYPKLRLALVEAGAGWMAFAANYMDRTWEKQRYWVDSQIRERPSFYMEQNVYTSFIHDRIGIETRRLPGAKNIMWSSDYPHSETTFPHSREVIARDFVGVPEADKHEIICGRAQKLFRIGQ